MGWTPVGRVFVVGWCVIMARRAVSWALVRKARRRILEVLTMAVAWRAMMMDAALVLWDFERMLGPVLIGAGGHGVVRVVPTLG